MLSLNHNYISENVLNKLHKSQRRCQTTNETAARDPFISARSSIKLGETMYKPEDREKTVKTGRVDRSTE